MSLYNHKNKVVSNMPVQKFKTFEEAERALWNFHPDEAYFKQVRALWNFANKINPIAYPRGIFKFKSMEEANRHREKIELEHAKEIRRNKKSNRRKAE